MGEVISRSTAWARENPERVKAQSDKRKKTLRGNANYKVAAARARARKKGLEFDIDIDFIVDLYEAQGGLCNLTGKKMRYSGKKGTSEMHDSFSIDRIDSTRGYTRCNVQLVCWGVNCMKNNMTMEQFFDFTRSLYHFNGLGED